MLGARRLMVAVAIVAMLALAACQSTPTGGTSPSAPVQSASSQAGDWAGAVDIGGGRSMFVICEGDGSPTVILIPGAREASDYWSFVGARGGQVVKRSDDAVFPQISQKTRTCSYDRPGISRLDGTVSPTTLVKQPTTAKAGVEDLHALLAAASIPPPYVLVAHSFGGMIAVLYSDTYPDEVAGMVLIDPSNVYFRSRLPARAWKDNVKQALAGVDGSGSEVPDFDASSDQLIAAAPAPGIPVTILTADKPWPVAGGSTKYFPYWLAASTDLAKQLSATHITQTHSGHHIPIRQPALVERAITSMLTAVK